MVDLKQALDAPKGAVSTIEMEGTKETIANVSANTTAVQEAAQ